MTKRINYSLTFDAVVNGCKFKAPRTGDCGYDIYSNVRVPIAPGKQVLIDTGLYLEIPHAVWGELKDRSSMANIRLYVNAGVIDPSYRGELKVALENRGDQYQMIEKADRIAQIVFQPYVSPMPNCVVELSDTERGEGGFGSTGK
jgi:dUTP pyrophosphatase